MKRWFMMDTNTVSYIVRGKSQAARRQLASLSSEEVACISSITEGEIRYGLARAKANPTLTAAIEGFLARILILPWGSSEAAACGELRAKLEKKGKPLGNLDMLIAAHAIAVGATLVTNDRAFLHLDGLSSTANWAIDI